MLTSIVMKCHYDCHFQMIQNQRNINMAKMLIIEHRLTVHSLSILSTFLTIKASTKNSFYREDS